MDQLAYCEYFLPSDSDPQSEIEDNEDHNDPIFTISDQNEAKCGSILISRQEYFTFVCEFCHKRFPGMDDFGLHLKMRHFRNQNEKTEAPEIERQSLPDNLKTAPDNSEQIEGSLNELDDSSPKEIEYLKSVSQDSEDPKDPSIDEPLVVNEAAEIKPNDFDELRFHCNICDYTFNTSTSFTWHKNHHLLISNKIQQQMRRSKRRPHESGDSREVEQSNETTDEPFHCNLCDLYFKALPSLKKHALAKHGNDIPQALQDDPTYLKCDFCHEQFESPLERANHEAQHDEDLRYKCQYCTKRFRQNSNRSLHERTHTGSQPFECPYCSRTFATGANQLQHVRTHLNIKLFVCNYCDKSFATSVLLSQHIRVHTEEKPYQCDECERSFRVSGQLFEHKKRHANVRDCKCDICGKMFTTNASVKRHKISHTDERPLECKVCGKTFQRSSALRAHEMLHDPEKRYECKICLKRFAQVAGLYWHKKTHEKETNYRVQ